MPLAAHSAAHALVKASHAAGGIHMKNKMYPTSFVLLSLFLVIGICGQWGPLNAAEGESLNVRVPAEAPKDLKDTTPAETLNSDEAQTPCPPAYIKLVSPRAARVGETISIQGWRFGNEEGTVIFPDGISAQVTLWRHQRIEVIVPEGAKTGNITITTACGSENKKGAGSYFKVIDSQTEK